MGARSIWRIRRIGRIRIDPSVVRGLEYYTGPVFEAELTFEVKDDDGRPVRFGSVGGGGRYDGLVARFRAEPVPATGFSIGVSRLLAALRAIKSPIVAAAETTGPVVVLALDRDADSMANYQRLVASLRKAGIAAELYLGSGGMNAQLKYADRRRSRVAIIQGSNERNAAGGPQVTIRDLKLGAELAKSTKDRADYLELRQRAQFPAPEAELVERVREVLAGVRARRFVLLLHVFYLPAADLRASVRSIDLDFLGACPFRRKYPRKRGLDLFGFPWILSSESSLFNGLHGKTDGNFFSLLFPRVCCAGMGGRGRATRKRRLVHEPSLSEFLIFCNVLSSEPVSFGRG